MVKIKKPLLVYIEIAQRKRRCNWCTVPILKGMSCLSVSSFNLSANLCINCVEEASDLLNNAHKKYVHDRETELAVVEITKENLTVYPACKRDFKPGKKWEDYIKNHKNRKIRRAGKLIP